MKTTVEILTEARDLISDESRWVKGRYFTEVDGKPCFCAIGAVEEAADGLVVNEPRWALEEVITDQWPDVESFNDHPDTTHAGILSVFDRAIAAVRGVVEEVAA